MKQQAALEERRGRSFFVPKVAQSDTQDGIADLGSRWIVFLIN
jgi:hypothetical protein